MSTGDNSNVAGLPFLRVNACPSLNCHVGMTYVAGYRSRRFPLASWQLVILQTPRESSEFVQAYGRVGAFLMSWDMQLANIWANLMGAVTLNTSEGGSAND